MQLPQSIVTVNVKIVNDQERILIAELLEPVELTLIVLLSAAPPEANRQLRVI
ncbi:MAG: hypothetical protein ACLU9S_13885 [Oscillospiraceae bacterium]